MQKYSIYKHDQEAMRAINKKRRCYKLLIGIIVGVVFLSIVAVCGWGFGTGAFFGSAPLTFTANGQEIVSADAIRWGKYVYVEIPEKPGYDSAGIIDENTGEMLFDAGGKSLSKVSKTDLSDFSSCKLSAVYSPHIYSANIMSSKNTPISTMAFTVESSADEVLDEPQILAGYRFDGWYTDSQFREPFSGNFWDYIDDEKPLTLYPHYSLDGWKLFWDLSGGEFLVDHVDDYTILSDIHLPTNDLVKRNGYTLKGWSLNGQVIEYFTPTVMKDSTLTAIWSPIEYTIRYYSDGGVFNESVKTAYTIEDSVILPEPIKVGYDFIGWFESRSSRERIFEIPAGSTGDINLYARYTPIVYSINYELCGGNNSLFNPNTYSAEQSVKLDRPIRDHYIFDGWFDSKTLTYIDELHAEINKDVFLVAHWHEVNYSIAYNLNGGEFNGLVKNQYTINDDFLLPIPFRNAYRFDGWYLDASYSERVTSITIHSFGDMAFFAKWSPIIYDITYDCAGGENNYLNPNTYTAESNVKLYNPTREGYEFISWKSKGTQIYKNQLNAVVDGNAELVAVWEAKIYKITVYNNNGQSATIVRVPFDSYYSLTRPYYGGHTFCGFTMKEQSFPDSGKYTYPFDISVSVFWEVNIYTISYISDDNLVSTQNVTFGEPYSLRGLQKPNYELEGWYTAKSGGQKASSGTYTTSSNITLYARWIKVMHIRPEQGRDFTVDSTVDKLYITGNFDGTNGFVNDMTVTISQRSKRVLTVMLENVGFKAKNGKAAIQCDNTEFKLYIVNAGISRIEGGNGYAGSNGQSGGNMRESNRNGANGGNGQSAINAGSVVFESINNSSSLVLKAGDGGKGGDGGQDYNRGRMWLNYLPNGGRGGDALSALTCTSYSINATDVNCLQGLPGRGGSAGCRGDWWTICWGNSGSCGIAYPAITLK